MAETCGERRRVFPAIYASCRLPREGQLMRMYNILLAVAVAVGIVFPAGLGWASLQNDPNAYTDPDEITWCGRVEFRGIMLDFLWYAADVEYCVYAPGDAFAESWPGATDPSNGEHFVYTYQIFNDLDPYPSFLPPWPEATGHVDTLTVGINGGDEQAANDGSISGSGDKAPTYRNINPTSVLWQFLNGVGGTNQINLGDVSDVLLFTSPFAPEWDSATLSGQLIDTEYLPSPMPEPMTLGLLALALGAAALLRTRRRRRTY